MDEGKDEDEDEDEEKDEDEEDILFSQRWTAVIYIPLEPPIPCQTASDIVFQHNPETVSGPQTQTPQTLTPAPQTAQRAGDKAIHNHVSNSNTIRSQELIPLEQPGIPMTRKPG